MSFLESIQHGLEKASQEASRITKIQHLHNVVNDLNFKAAQEGQALLAKAMEMYHQGILAQGELTAICQQIATYQQQINEVHEELQRLQSDAPEADVQIPQPPQPAQAYAPGAVPPGYPPYPAPPAGYPPYPAPQGYPYPAPPAGYAPYPAAPQPGYPAAPPSPSGEPPTKPGAPVVEDEPPTQPLNFPGEAAAAAPEAEAKPALHKPRQHHTAAAAAPAVASETPAPEAAPAADSAAAPASGTYANGVLPPIFSPFTANPTGAPTAPAAPAELNQKNRRKPTTRKKPPRLPRKHLPPINRRGKFSECSDAARQRRYIQKLFTLW